MLTSLAEDENSGELTSEIRERLSVDRDPYERRTDTLARLLEGRQTCLSIALINDQFFATANEFFSGTKANNNQGYTSILDIFDYFCELANRDISDERRQKVFIQICLEHLKGLGKEKPPILETVSNQIIELILADTNLTQSKFIEKFGHQSALAGSLYGEFRNLYRDFNKIESSIRRKRDHILLIQEEVDIELTDQQFEALKNKRIQILHTEPKGVAGSSKREMVGKGQESVKKGKADTSEKISNLQIHAEVQLLSYLVGLIENKQLAPQKFYFGISKLCCLNCRVTIEAANSVFAEDKQYQGFEIITRGRHDLDFDRWEPPAKFAKGFYDEISEKEASLSDKIGKLAQKNIEKLKSQISPSGISMNASQSSSEDEAALNFQIEEAKQKLQMMLSIATAFSVDTKIMDMIDVLKMAIELHDLDNFRNSYFDKPVENKRFHERTKQIFLQFSKRITKFNFSEEKAKNIALAVLSNSELVGEKMAKRFSDFNLSAYNENPESFSFVPKEQEDVGLNVGNKEKINIQIQEDYRLAWQLQAEEYQRSKEVQAGSPEKSGYPSFSKKLLKIYSIQSQTFILKHVKGDGDCFFHAVNQPGFNRDNLVNKLLEHIGYHAVRQAFATEIRQFLYLGYSGFHERELEQNACQLLLGRQNSKIRTLFSRLKAIEENVSKAVIDVRQELGEEETHGESPEELLETIKNKLQSFMRDIEEQELNQSLKSKEKRYQDLIEALNEALQQRRNLNECITAYCEEENVFKNYVNIYLGTAEGYVPVSRKLPGEEITTTIDVINQIFNLNIQVHLQGRANSEGLIQITDPRPDNGEPINIFHNGIDHFDGLQLFEPVLEEEMQAEQSFGEEEEEQDKVEESSPSFQADPNLKPKRKEPSSDPSQLLTMYESKRVVKQKLEAHGDLEKPKSLSINKLS